MLKIGLTGGIGGGKTTVARIFESLGIPVFYADDAARELLNTDEALKQLIRENFGEESYSEGQLNRKYISGIVFNDPEKLKLLNSLTHPPTISEAENWMARQRSPYIIKEAALLFESGSNKGLDHVIGVTAPLEIRIQRVIERDGLTREEVLNRMKRQMNEEEKMKVCDYVVINDGSDMVLGRVLELHELFLRESSKNQEPGSK